MANHPKSNPRPTIQRDDAMTALVVWEALLDQQKWEKENAGSDMLACWENYGAWEMRETVLNSIAPWVNKVWRYIEKQMGEDEEPLISLGMDAWDWEFVPACLEYIIWDKQRGPERLDVERTGALIIANAALKDKAA